MGWVMNVKFNGDLEKIIADAAKGTMKQAASEHQKMLDSLVRRYKGRPVAEIKPVLKREWSRNGGSISDPGLTEYATLISEGTRFQVKVGR